ncbi:hypothetical protein ILUMI_22092 [Ignelater luminosus]|uniref:Endonuclease/exonuclease/phosphatase domain-containing protein n=1 Tax=Ignelater luminosus TaxID=2038154 RepID=A0A8K0CGF8_IGNLU|nr:hypothetical protein ILUMI_22092 [Ignelater luminosus]
MEFDKADLDILAITETKKKRQGTQEWDEEHLLIYIYNKKQRAAEGIASTWCIPGNTKELEPQATKAISQSPGHSNGHTMNSNIQNNDSSQGPTTRKLGLVFLICQQNIEVISKFKSECLSKPLLERNIDIALTQEIHTKDIFQFKSRSTVNGYKLVGATYSREHLDNVKLFFTSENNANMMFSSLDHPVLFAGDFNSHCQWKYKKNKDPETFTSGRWRTNTNPELTAFDKVVWKIDGAFLTDQNQPKDITFRKRKTSMLEDLNLTKEGQKPQTTHLVTGYGNFPSRPEQLRPKDIANCSCGTAESATHILLEFSLMEVTSYEYVRKKPASYTNGFFYIQEKTARTTVCWRCECWKTKGHKSRERRKLRMKQDRIHEGTPIKLEVAKVVNAMKVEGTKSMCNHIQILCRIEQSSLLLHPFLLLKVEELVLPEKYTTTNRISKEWRDEASENNNHNVPKDSGWQHTLNNGTYNIELQEGR